MQRYGKVNLCDTVFKKSARVYLPSVNLLTSTPSCMLQARKITKNDIDQFCSFQSKEKDCMMSSTSAHNNVRLRHHFTSDIFKTRKTRMTFPKKVWVTHSLKIIKEDFERVEPSKSALIGTPSTLSSGYIFSWHIS